MPDTQMAAMQITMKLRLRDRHAGELDRHRGDWDKASRIDRERYCARSKKGLEAALSGPVVGWRTMDSAPKSKNILLFAVTDIAEDGEVKNWKMHSGAFHTGYGAWEWAGRILQPYEVQPTHWQHLPAPPVPEMEK